MNLGIVSRRTRPTLLLTAALAVALAVSIGALGASPAHADQRDPARSTTLNDGGMSPNDGVVTPRLIAANEETAFDYFVGKGLSEIQSAGVVGNLVQESGVDPTAVQAGGPGRGIAQWGVGGRWDTDPINMVDYAADRGLDVWALGPQLDFVWYELTNESYLGLADLRASTTISDATIAFMEEYERCGTCLPDQRVAYAQDAYDRYAG